MNSDNKAFWERIHRENTRYWLTDSDPGSVYKLHNLTKEILVPEKNILEIGVGTGRSIMHLKELHNVFAVDIAETALDRVKTYATIIQVYDKDKWPVNKINIALCHLVFQHCNDSVFRFIIERVLESLVPDGFFSFQSADADDSKLDNHYRKSVNDNLMFFRQKNEIIDKIEELGGRVISISDDILHPNECDIVWNIFRIAKVKEG